MAYADHVTRETKRTLAALICSTPEFLHLFRRMRAQWRKLRSLSLAIRAVARETGTPLTGRLLKDAQVSEPLDRESGCPVEEKLIATWTDAVQALRADADAKLPSTRYEARSD